MDGVTALISQHALFNLEVNSSLWTSQDRELSVIIPRNLVS